MTTFETQKSAETLNSTEIKLQTYTDNHAFWYANGQLNRQGLKEQLFSTFQERAAVFQHVTYELDIVNGQITDPVSGRTMEDICSMPIYSPGNKFVDRARAELEGAQFLDREIEAAPIGTVFMEASATCDGHGGSLQSMVRTTQKISNNKVRCFSILIPETDAQSSLLHMIGFVAKFRTDLLNAANPEEIISKPTILNLISNPNTRKHIFDQNGNFNELGFLSFIDIALSEITGKKYIQGKPEELFDAQNQRNYELLIETIESLDLIGLYELSLQGSAPLTSVEVMKLMLNIQDEIKNAFNPEARAKELQALLSDKRNLEDKNFISQLTKTPSSFDLMEIGGVSISSIPEEILERQKKKSEEYSKKPKKSESKDRNNIRFITSASITINTLPNITLPKFDVLNYAGVQFGRETTFDTKSRQDSYTKKTKAIRLPDLYKSTDGVITFATSFIENKSVSLKDSQPKEVNLTVLKQEKPKEPKTPPTLRLSQVKGVTFSSSYSARSNIVSAGTRVKITEQSSATTKEQTSKNNKFNTKKTHQITQSSKDQTVRNTESSGETISVIKKSNIEVASANLSPKIVKVVEKRLGKKETKKATETTSGTSSSNFKTQNTIPVARQTEVRNSKLFMYKSRNSEKLRAAAKTNLETEIISESFSTLQIIEVFRQFGKDNKVKYLKSKDKFKLNGQITDDQMRFLKSLGLTAKTRLKDRAVIIQPTYKRTTVTA